MQSRERNEIKAELDITRTKLAKETARKEAANQNFEAAKRDVRSLRLHQDRFDDAKNDAIMAEYSRNIEVMRKEDHLLKVKTKLLEWRHDRMKRLDNPIMPNDLQHYDLLDPEVFEAVVKGQGGRVDQLKDYLYITKKMLDGKDELPDHVLDIIKSVPQY